MRGIGLARLLAAGLMILVAVGGCTPHSPESTRASTSETVSRDRDADAVLAAVRLLDLCALASPAPAGYSLVATGPFTCQGRQDLVGDFSISVGDFETVSRKTYGPATSVGGVKAYVGRSEKGQCGVHLPVSFDLAIGVGQETATDNLCTILKEIAARVATRLANPDKYRVEPRWDACGLLSAATDGKVLVDGRLDNCLGANDTSLRLTYEPMKTRQDPPARKEVLDGTQVQVWEFAGCEVSWSAGKPPASHVDKGATFRVEVNGGTCDVARELARRVIPVVRTAPPTDVAPQRPILYRPDEPDMPN